MSGGDRRSQLPPDVLDAFERLTRGDFTVRLQRGSRTDAHDEIAALLDDLAGALSKFTKDAARERRVASQVTEEARVLMETVEHERKELEAAVSDLSERFVALAAGDFTVQAPRTGTGEPLDVLAYIFNNAVVELHDAMKTARTYGTATAAGRIGTWEWYRATGKTSWNEEAHRLLGVVEGTVVPSYEAFLERIHPEDRPAFSAALDAAMKEGAPIEIDCRVPRQDGEGVCQISGKVELDDRGKATHLFGTIQDVTERRAIENELKSTKERYDFATAVGKVGTWDWNVASGQLSWSDETFRLMGFEPGAVAPTYELYLGLVHPDDRDRLNAGVQAALNERTPYDLDCRIVLHDGKQLVCHVTGSVDFAPDGRPRRMLGTIQDVTDRKRIEDELKDAKARQDAALESVLDSMVDGVLMLDREGVVVRSNRAATSLLAAGGADLVGRRFRDLLARPELVPALEVGSSLRDLEILFREVEGAPLSLSANVSPQRTGDGGVVGSVVLLRDDRPLRQARAQLQLNDRLATMGTLAAGVAHEINNPLGFVVGNLDFIADELEALKERAPKEAEWLADVLDAVRASQDGAKRVRNIVLDLKALSRSDADAGTEVSLNRLADSAANMLRHEFRSKVKLVRELGQPPTVLGNEGKLLQVILNLLQNAAQAFGGTQKEAPEVCVRTGTTAEGAAFLEVQDNGCGIPDEIRQRIFDAFFTTKPAGLGTGLGLSISQKIISSMGGSLGVTSEVGRGSTFRIELPAQKAATS